jgi:hypothetical protein
MSRRRIAASLALAVWVSQACAVSAQRNFVSGLAETLELFLPPGTSLSQKAYRFTGVGIAAERGGIVLQAEVVR